MPKPITKKDQEKQQIERTKSLQSAAARKTILQERDALRAARPKSRVEELLADSPSSEDDEIEVHLITDPSDQPTEAPRAGQEIASLEAIPSPHSEPQSNQEKEKFTVTGTPVASASTSAGSPGTNQLLVSPTTPSQGGLLNFTPSSSSSSSSSSSGSAAISKSGDCTVVQPPQNIFTKSSSTSPHYLPPLPEYPYTRAPERTWQHYSCPDEEEYDDDDNPFGLPPPPKHRQAVLHPDIEKHLRGNPGGQKRGIKPSLTEAQRTLILADFDKALDNWEPTFTCPTGEKWKALEASRYATFNPVMNRADVNVAVKLLVPAEDAEDWEASKKYCVSIRATEHQEEQETYLCRFALLPPQEDGRSASHRAPAVPAKEPEVRQAAAKENKQDAVLTGSNTKLLAQAQKADVARPGATASAANPLQGRVGGGNHPSHPDYIPPTKEKEVQPAGANPLQAGGENKKATSDGAKPQPQRTSPALRPEPEPEQVDIFSSSDDDDWDVTRLNLLKEQILEVHDKTRNSHQACGKGDPGYFEHKYHILRKHLSTTYPNTRRKGQLPPSQEQASDLIDLVIADCPTCTRLRKEKRQQKADQDKAQALAAQAAKQREEDWKVRFEHRLQADEYETDADHVPDDTCAVCKCKAGRRGKVGAKGRYGDAWDRDDLFNCEGCTKAFHHDCRPGLLQDTPEARRRYGLPSDKPLTFARRSEPHLCPECWRNAPRRQKEHEYAQLEAKVAKLQEENDRYKRARVHEPVNHKLCLSSDSGPIPDRAPAPPAEATPRYMRDGDDADEQGRDRGRDLFHDLLRSSLPKKGCKNSTSTQKLEKPEQWPEVNFSPGNRFKDPGLVADPDMTDKIVQSVGCTTSAAQKAFAEASKQHSDPLTAMVLAVTELTKLKMQSPLEKISALYRGEVQECFLESTEQCLYYETRKFVVDLLKAEAGLPNECAIDQWLNTSLERTSNVWSAFVQVAEFLNVEARVVNESLSLRIGARTEEDLQAHLTSCQAGFLRIRAEARRQAQEYIALNAQCTGNVAMTAFTQEFRNRGDLVNSVQEAIRGIKDATASRTEVTETTNDVTPTLTLHHEPPLSEALTPERQPNGNTTLPHAEGTNRELSSILDSTLEVGAKTTTNKAQSLEEADRTLGQCYAQALLDESYQSNMQGVNYSLQLERPYQWEDTSPDPKYPCVGYTQRSYVFWKNHCQKRRAQGAQQRYVTFISFPIVKMICSTLRIVPQTDIFKWSDEELLRRLDAKFQIAQETNLLTKKFEVPERPSKLASFELHIPHEEFHLYATAWLKELTINQERHKDLNKYDLSDVFIQSLKDCKLLYDHARVLTKLSVEDLIASCSDYLQTQVMNEARTAALRKQLGGFEHSSRPKPEKCHEDLAKNRGSLTLRQAKAFMTEANKMIGGGISKAHPAIPPEGVVPFVRTKEHTINCEGCGKWYINYPERRFPNPCSGRCQYTGHPAMNKRYLDGIKWKLPGFCCSWLGIPNKDIPPETLARLQKYQIQRPPRQ